MTQQPDSTRADLFARLVTFFCVFVLTLSLIRIILGILGITAWWLLISACVLAFISGSITIGGDPFKNGRLSSRSIAILAYLAILSTLLLVVQLVFGERVVPGLANRDSSVAVTDPSLLPFTVAVSPFAGGNCGTYIFDSTVDNLKPIPDFTQGGMDELDQWLHKHKAVQSLDYGSKGIYGQVVVNISGGADSPVTITGLSFIRSSYTTSGAPGIIVSGQCGEGISGRFAEVNLDSEPPQIVATNTNPNAMWGSPSIDLVPMKFPYVINRHDVEEFYIMANTTGNAAFRMQLDYFYQDRKGTAIIDDHGMPFRVGAPIDGISAYRDSYLLTAGGELRKP